MTRQKPGNYRPTAVGELLLRLFAALLSARLVIYTESAGLRAPKQAGFRPWLCMVHKVFALQHLVDHARLHKQPLFCCFLYLLRPHPAPGCGRRCGAWA